MSLVAGVILAVVAVPVVRTAGDDADADAIVALVEDVERAVWAHYRDTDRLAIEDSRVPHGDPRRRRLSAAAGASGWRGPYLARPLDERDNPFGGPVVVEDTLAGSLVPTRGGGFAFSPNGRRARGAGQLLVIGDVPVSCAREVDARLERSEVEDWQTLGRVQWCARTGTLLVFILDV